MKVGNTDFGELESGGGVQLPGDLADGSFG